MVFSNLIFLGLFLPIVLTLYFLTYKFSDRIQWLNWILLAASLIFYAWGEPVWVMFMLLTATNDYCNGLRMAYADKPWKRKAALLGSIFVDLGLLFCMKYLGFATEILNMLLPVTISVPDIIMPIGISFYTFQSLSYLLDLYWGKTEVQNRYSDYVLYITMFPQLVAGPIVRYSDIAVQLQHRIVTLDGFQQGTEQFLCGLGKKVILANYAGEAASLLLDGDLSSLSVCGAWLGIVLYAFQIYFDFSGYSDMAIGLGRMFGFVYQENFRYPYLSTSVTEFWRRWHISLGSFFRDYVYIPLGGNRHDQMRNILVVWSLTGLWHGASWNFIAWGLYYGILLIIEKKWLLSFIHQHKYIGWCYTAMAVLFGWALFYYIDLSQFLLFITACIPFGTDYIIDMHAASVFRQYFWMFPVWLLACTPYPKQLLLKMRPVYSGGILFAGILCIVFLIGQSYNPFLYFRF